MPNVTLNGVVFNGLPSDPESTPRAPQKAPRQLSKAGIALRSDNGTRRTILVPSTSRPNAVVLDWVLEWKRVPLATRNAVFNIACLTSTFSFTDPDGTRTVQLPPDQGAYTEELDIVAPDGTTYYNVTLTVQQP